MTTTFESLNAGDGIEGPTFAVSREWTFVLQTGIDWFVIAEEHEPEEHSGS